MRNVIFSMLIHVLILIITVGVRFPFREEIKEPLQVAVGRPPSGLPSIPAPAGVGTKIKAVSIPMHSKSPMVREEKSGPSLSIPGQKFGWGKKRLHTSFGEVDIPGGKGGGRPWYIEGDVQGRKVIKEVIPKYPSNYDREAKIKLSFQVSPEGEVTDVLVAKKGDARLERISIDAFSQWRFESIPDTVTQQGEITFIFRLK